MAEWINRNSELPKQQDCTSPSPTETVCLDSICADNNPGELFTFEFILKSLVHNLVIVENLMNNDYFILIFSCFPQWILSYIFECIFHKGEIQITIIFLWCYDLECTT